MSKGQAGGEMTEGQDGCAEPVLAAPALALPLAHRIALGKVSLVGGMLTITPDQTRPVKLVRLQLDSELKDERHYVALRDSAWGNPTSVDGGSSATILCSGAVAGAVRVTTLAPTSTTLQWKSWAAAGQLPSVFGHSAGGRRTWVFIKVSTSPVRNSVKLDGAGREFSAEVVEQPGPLAPILSNDGYKIVAGYVVRNDLSSSLPTVITYSGARIEIPTEQNPDNFGPQIDFASQVLFGG
jgi:hypothetical protein